MIQNLVDNSIKYKSPERSPAIVISTEAPAGSAAQSGTVILTVSDNGRGITENNHQKVFEMFQRLSSPGSVYGSGIGLATVARIAQRCGASIAVDSDGHSGTSISITFPRPVLA
jgi:signal transduction histidine kinase